MKTILTFPSDLSLEKFSENWVFKNQNRFLLLLATIVLIAMSGFTYLTVSYIEYRTLTKFQNLTKDFSFEWLEVKSNGTKVELSGNPPNQIDYLGVISLANLNFDPDGIINNIQEPETSYTPKQSLDLQLYAKNDAVFIFGSFSNQDQRSTTLDLLKGLQPGKTIKDFSTLKTDNESPEFNSVVEFGTKVFSQVPDGVVSIVGQSVSVTSHLASQDQVDLISIQLQAEKPDTVDLNINLTFPLPLVKPYKFGIFLDNENSHLEACHVEDKESRNRIYSVLSSISPNQQFSCQISLGTPFVGWSDLIVQLLGHLSDTNPVFLRVSDLSVYILSETDLPDQKRIALEETLNNFPGEDFNVQILSKTNSSDAINPEFLRISKDVNNKITIFGTIPDNSIKSLIFEIISSYLLQDKIDDFTIIKQGSDLSDLNLITNGIKSLVHLETGELVIPEKGIYLSGKVSSAVNRDTLIQYLNSEFSIEDYILDIEVDADILLERLLSPEQCNAGVERILSNEKITFDSGSIEISNQTKDIIVELAKVLRKCNHLSWEIGGHTDNQGREKMNLELSTKRAEAVLFALEFEGVSTDNILAKGYGESSPIASNRTKVGRELNRRIVIKLQSTEQEN